VCRVALVFEQIAQCSREYRGIFPELPESIVAANTENSANFAGVVIMVDVM
jgi:hypothetical protein